MHVFFQEKYFFDIKILMSNVMSFDFMRIFKHV